MDSQHLDYYQVLGLDSKAADADIRRAYLQQSRRWHPDKALQNGISSTEATAQFQRISVANETLSDPLARRRYDVQQAQRSRWQSSAGSDAGFNFGFKFGRGGFRGSGGGFNFGFNQSHGNWQYDDEPRESVLKSAGDVWKAFVPGNISEDDFTRWMRNCFSDFDDGPRGFYVVFNKLFKKIWAVETTEGSENSSSPPPEFGASDSVWKSGPGLFYKHWRSFSTTQKLQSTVAKSSASDSKQAKRAEAKKRQKAAHDAYNRKVHTLLDLLQALDPRVKAEERRMEKRAEDQHVENTSRLQAERARREKELQEERAESRRRQQEQQQQQQEEQVPAGVDDAESDFGHSGVGAVDVLLVVTPDGVVMTCQQATEAAAQDASVVAEAGAEGCDEAIGSGNDSNEAAEQSSSIAGSEDGESSALNSTESSSESSEPEVLYCQACRKYFQSENQFANHEASKKHKKEQAAYEQRMRT